MRRGPVQVLGAKVAQIKVFKPKLTSPIPIKPSPPEAKSAPDKVKRMRARAVRKGGEKKKICTDFAITSPFVLGKKYALGTNKIYNVINICLTLTYNIFADDRYSVSIDMITFKGDKGKGQSYTYEALIFTREGYEDGDESKGKKPFKFTIPSKLVKPLFEVLRVMIADAKI